MTAREGKSGTFIKWLEELGLEDFIRHYPLSQLVEWGWLVPQYRLPFPKRFFESWDNYPCNPWDPPADLDEYATLWDYSWSIDDESDTLWFLDPIFHPDSAPGQLLRQHVYIEGDNSIPEKFDHARGITITPYVDYYYRWQGYALVDIIRHADNIQSVYSTPDIVERAKSVLRIAEHVSATHPNWPQGILTAPKRWGGLCALMTQLDHFRGMRDAISNIYNINPDIQQELYRRGAHSLAEHFQLTSDLLADSIKTHLLALAHEWMGLNTKLTKRSIWTLRAWPHLQAEIMTAMSWLIVLSEKS